MENTENPRCLPGVSNAKLRGTERSDSDNNTRNNNDVDNDDVSSNDHNSDYVDYTKAIYVSGCIPEDPGWYLG